MNIKQMKARAWLVGHYVHQNAVDRHGRSYRWRAIPVTGVLRYFDSKPDVESWLVEEEARVIREAGRYQGLFDEIVENPRWGYLEDEEDE